MIRNVVISVSIGTGILLVGLVLLICASIAVAAVGTKSPSKPLLDVYRSKTGMAGEVERSINDLKYGPVNLDAAKEIKNGGLFSRIRDQRQSRACAPDQQCSQVQQSTVQSVRHQQPTVQTTVIVGAIKLYKARESLSKIDVSDGLDESEIQLIRDALLRKKQMDADVQEKAKLVAASQKLAEVAKAP